MPDTDAGTKRVFVSYARTDKELALTTSNALEAAGVPVWIDQRHIPPGERWDVTVQQALQDCPRLLVVLTPRSVKSENVLDEVDYALARADRSVLPVIGETYDVPFRLRRLQYIDLTHDPEDAYARLCAHLLSAKPIGGPRSSAGRVSPLPKQLRLWALAASVTVAVAAFTWAAWPDQKHVETAISPAASVRPPKQGLDTLDVYYSPVARESRSLETRGARVLSVFRGAYEHRSFQLVPNPGGATLAARATAPQSAAPHHVATNWGA